LGLFLGPRQPLAEGDPVVGLQLGFVKQQASVDEFFRQEHVREPER
jgi:hypothetical protein